MINLKNLKCCLENYIMMTRENKHLERLEREEVGKRITIKRKKKMILEQTANGDIKNKRKNVIKIEIIE